MTIKCQHFRDKQQFNAKLMFDKDLKVTKAGKTFKIYDAIQEANVDTDIYEVARKYGMVGAEKECAQTYLAKNYNQLEEEFQEVQDLRSVLDQSIKANNMWSDLPIEIKREFNNDVNEFRDRGQEWIGKIASEFRRKQEELKAQQQQTNVQEGEKINEQK